MNSNRLNKRQYGTLKGKGLKKAEKLVEQQGSIGCSGEYGSITVDEKDFIQQKQEHAQRETIK